MPPKKKAVTLWLTGLPCSGKTTLSNALQTKLGAYGFQTKQLDGDLFRRQFSSPLGYSKEDRMKNILHIVSEALRWQKKGVVTLVSVISPYQSMRDDARKKLENLIEVFVRCPLEVCEKRDVKGMYKLARQGKIKNFTGVSDPYEDPLHPEVTVHTDLHDVGVCTQQITTYLESTSVL